MPGAEGEGHTGRPNRRDTSEGRECELRPLGQVLEYLQRGCAGDGVQGTETRLQEMTQTWTKRTEIS